MSPKVLASLSTPTTLGSVLLVVSATLFAVDVGGTYVLDSDRFAHTDAPHVTGTHILPRAAAPIARDLSTGGASASVAFASDSAPAPQRLAASVLFAPQTEREPVARSLRSNTEPRLRAGRHVTATVGRRVVARTASAHAFKAPFGSIRRRWTRPVIAVALAKRPTIDVRSNGVAPKAPASPTATLREVRRFVMGKLKARDSSSSVISSNTFTKNGNVLVCLVVRDKDHEWFEKDIVRRNGQRLAIDSTMLHTFLRARLRSHVRAITATISTTT